MENQVANFEKFPSGIYIEIYCQSKQEQNAIDKKVPW